jgi:hypothetical protein
MRPRVLILARENVLHWAPLYIEAFRQCCDVIVAGPALNRAGIAEHGWEHTEQWLVPNDIITDADDVLEVLGLLPDRWLPDLIVGIQSSGPLYRNLPALRCPKVYLSIDSWHDHREFKAARPYDFVYVAQKVFAPWFDQCGAPAEWLPLAHSPAYHHPVDVPKEYDITFGGALHWRVNRERRMRLEMLADHYSVLAEGGIGGEDLCRHFCRGRIAFNSSIHHDINMRVFEALGMGMPLLTNRSAELNGLLELFEDGDHLVTYNDDSLIARAADLLNGNTRRENIATAGHREVLERHTYRHRVDTILNAALPEVGDRGLLLRDDPQLATWLPCRPGRVLDVGLHCERSKVALRRLGVTELAGAHPDQAHPRGRSYDTLLPFPLPDPAEPFNTILWAAQEELVADLDHGITNITPHLATGGTIVFRMNLSVAESTPLGQSTETWDNWLHGHHLHLIHLQPFPEDNALIVIARKFTRPLLEVSKEIYTRFPAPKVV